MPERITVDAPPAAEGATTVGASALALHLDCSRADVGKLKAEGVVAPNRLLLTRPEPRRLPAISAGRASRSPRTEADAAHVMPASR
jgi:hypothetical protein